MEYNLPVWGYYPSNDEYFVDPMYVPYVRDLVPDENGRCGECEINPWKKQGYADGFVHPELVRKGWGLGFQLMHADKDPCPEGWTKGIDGWCVENKPEFQGTFYTEKAFVPKYQYWDSYAPKLINPRAKQINEFDQRSVNPWTGNYVVYNNPRPASNRIEYGSLSSKDSLLA